jgi:cytochrome c553
LNLNSLAAAVFTALLMAAPPALAASNALVGECVPCHGLDGIGRDAEVPNIAGQNEVYLLNQLRAFKQGKRPHKEMLFMSRHMNDEDMQSLAAYYAGLPPR